MTAPTDSVTSDSVELYLLKWGLLATPLGIAVGTACAAFLTLLDWATATRFSHPWLFYGLPLAGLLVAGLYALWGRSVEAGNNLIIDEIHRPGGGVPLRMTPLILIGTVITHLCGGSAGREGTAVQMGGSLASAGARWWHNGVAWQRRRNARTASQLHESPDATQPDATAAEQVQRRLMVDTRCLLMMGVAAGFGGVFGTPVAGAVFALEVLVVGRMNLSSLFPCLVASFISDQACAWWGVGHTHYAVASLLPAGSTAHLAPINFRLLGAALVVGVCCGWASWLFAELTHTLQGFYRQRIPQSWLRPFVGGCAIVVLVQSLGLHDFLGLGVTSPDPNAVTIVRCFEPGGVEATSWFWKLLLTALTVSCGFKGGEVTPLFFIGAALGHTLAVWLAVPVDFLAALGFVAVFAGATNTPIACTLMAVELFGGELLFYFALACTVAFLFSGHHGIYLSQQIHHSKWRAEELPAGTTLRGLRESRRNQKSPPRRVEQNNAIDAVTTPPL